MAFKNYASPHVHIQSLDSASTPKAFAKRELELGTGAITCTDHGSMGACRETYALAKKNKLIPILGLEAYVRDDDCPILLNAGFKKDEKTGKLDKYHKYYHMTFHAMDQAAYEALAKELSAADFRAERHGSEMKPLFTWAQLEKLAQYNLTATTGCLIGMVQRHLLSDRPDLAFAYADKMVQLFGKDKLYVEIFPHRCTHKWEDGIFVTLEGGERLKFYADKKISTSVYQDITAEDLSKLVGRGKDVGKLVAIMTDRKMKEIEPKQILSCVAVSDFIQNECRSWAPDGDVQLGANKFMMHFAKSRGLKMLISDDAHFATEDEKIIQDSRLSNGKSSWKFHNSYHRQTSNESFAYFRDYMGVSERDFEAMLDSNLEWTHRFKNFEFKDRVSLPKSFYPTDTLAHVKKLIEKHGRMDWNNEVWKARLQKELDLLHANGKIDLLPYFFIGEEVCSLYEQNDMLTGPGRGSAAGLLLAYLLGITHVDPIRYQLSEDRFLTKDRIDDGKLPDIDQDLPDRELLIDPKEGWIYKRFGANVAAISTNTMLRLKSSIKDVHRALHGRVDPEIEALCKKLPNPPQGIDDAAFVFGYRGDDGKEVKGLIEDSKELKDYTLKYAKEWEIVEGMLGIARQKSKHACAYVIADEPIDNFIPLQTINGVRTTQYTAGWVEAAGGLKMDFLGLNSLKDLSAALKLIQERHGGIRTGDTYLDGKRVPGFRLVPVNGQYYDIWDLPADQAVFNSIAEGRTETVFQLNTNSARQWLRQFNYEKKAGVKAIDSIEAISAFTALDRPGPLDATVKDPVTGREHNMLVEFARRARGEEPTDPIKALDVLIPETYGVMVYQEQLQKIYQYVTDCTGIEANQFRTNVAKKQMEKVLAAYPNFLAKGTQKLGEEDTKKIWDQTVTFGQYGFNKSHAVCYSIIAYASAYLKHHFPLEWWCAVLKNADKNEITEKFWRHSKHVVDLPDVRFSADNFEIQDERIRMPLSFINGVGPNAHDELCLYRPYVDIHDFCRKNLNHKLQQVKPKLDELGNPVLDAKGKQKMTTGRSSLNRGIVYKLIVSGVMDSMFPPEADSVIAKISYYEEACMQAQEELTGKKKKLSKADKEKQLKYANVDPLSKFQLQKAILPIYTEPLAPILHRVGVPGVQFYKNTYLYRPTEADTIRDVKIQMNLGDRQLEEVELCEGAGLKFYNEEYALYDGQYLAVATPAYVVLERRFTYNKGKGPRTAVELVFDSNGEQFSMIKWPDRETGRQTAPPEGLTGALVILYLTRWKEDRPFTIDAIAVVKEPRSEEPETTPEVSPE